MKTAPIHQQLRTSLLTVDSQNGAVLIEFSLVLITMLTLFYGIVVYSIVFVSQQAVAYAAESGADAVVVVNPDDSGFAQLATTVATARVTSLLTFLPGGETTTVVVGTPVGSPGREVTVTVNYAFSNWGFLVTGLLPLPGILTGQALVNTQ